ncbi:MAG: molybdenum ABC transporter ATP-binding protein [Pseudomonadales bacterium]
MSDDSPSAGTLHLDVALTLDAFDLAITTSLPLEGVTAVFGPSGSGKSTLLRTVAGFVRPARGCITCGEDIWFDAERRTMIPPHRRPVGYMFQDGRLFNHLDVAGNLAFAERRVGKRSGVQATERIDPAHVRDVLDLGPLLGRRIVALSGGERQRVALARTLLTRPRVLLLDEPLAALDTARKADILPYLERLPRDFGIPALYVSHDIDEVAHVADRILILARGRLQASGPTAEILERFDLAPYTGRFEAGVLVEGQVSRHDDRLKLTAIEAHGATLTVPYVPELPIGTSVRLRVRARDVAIATRPPEGLSIRNVLPGTIDRLQADPEAGSAELVIDTGGPRLRARLTLAAVEELSLEEGLDVYALIKSVGLEGSVGTH